MIRRAVEAFACTIVFASAAHADVTFGTTYYRTPGIGASCEMTIAVDTSADRALIVGVHTASAVVTSVDGAGARWPLSPVITATSASNHVEIWIATNPQPGMQTVRVTFGASDTDIICGVSSFSGVDQDHPTSHAIATVGVGGTAEVPVSSASGDMTFALMSHDRFFMPPEGCTDRTDWFTNPNTQNGQGTHCSGAPITTFRWVTSIWLPTSQWAAAGVDIRAAVHPTWTGIVATGRAIDWSRAGVVGGIPLRAAGSCATLSPGSTADEITAAIVACGDSGGGVVSLEAGVYPLATGISFKGRSGVTLRGAGADRTTLVFSGADPCGGMGADICVINSTGYWTGSFAVLPGGTNSARWIDGYAQGATTLTLSSTAGLSVGDQIILDQDNDVTAADGVLVCDTVALCSQVGGATGRTFDGVSRSQQQFVTIEAVSGSTITISAGLYMPNWRAAQAPGVWWTGPQAESDGIEDLTVDHAGTTAASGIYFFNARNGWVRSVKSLNGPRNHVWMYQSSHIQVQDSYFYGTRYSAAESYGIEAFMTSDDLVVNNIFQHVTSPIIAGAATGSVFAYNFMIDMAYFAPTWMESSINGGHAAGTGMNLFEGNEGTQFTQDDYHGSANLATLFRNRFSGSEPGKISNTEVINLFGSQRYANMLGNVLGTAGVHTLYEDEQALPLDPTRDPNKAIYLIGYSGVGESSAAGIARDPLVKSTMFRWGNVDVVHGAAQFDPAEVPTNLPALANPVPGDLFLPASFFLAAKPDWWGARPWPSIGPDVAGGDEAAGHVYWNPAHLCFLNSPKDDAGVISPFDPSSCYPAR